MQAARTGSGSRVVLRPSLSEIERLATWIDGVACAAGLGQDTIFALQLCLEEAIANIIMYSGAPEDAPISIEFAPGNGAIAVIIEDSGRPFDPTSLPPHVKPASLDETRIGELGVHLIRQYSRSMCYERFDGRNRLTLTFDPKTAAART